MGANKLDILDVLVIFEAIFEAMQNARASTDPLVDVHHYT